MRKGAVTLGSPFTEVNTVGRRKCHFSFFFFFECVLFSFLYGSFFAACLWGWGTSTISRFVYTFFCTFFFFFLLSVTMWIDYACNVIYIYISLRISLLLPFHYGCFFFCILRYCFLVLLYPFIHIVEYFCYPCMNGSISEKMVSEMNLLPRRLSCLYIYIYVDA